MKLQKLLYYCQAWSLAWDGVPLFDDPIEAWANGPVVRDVWERTRDRGPLVDYPIGNGKITLNANSPSTIASVMAHYRKQSGRVLSDLTHVEDPWVQTRIAANALDGQPSNAVITNESMRRYYSELEQ